MKQVIRVNPHWGKLEENDKDTSLTLSNIINWHYKKKDVVKIDFCNNMREEWAYITVNVN